MLTYLISWVGLCESIQLVHFLDVAPQVGQLNRDLVAAEKGTLTHRYNMYSYIYHM